MSKSFSSTEEAVQVEAITMSDKPILYSWPFSPPVRAVWLTARFIELDMEIKLIDVFKMEHLSPEYLKVSTNAYIESII